MTPAKTGADDLESVVRPWRAWLATGCGVGDLPGAPGTWGTLAGLPIVWGLSLFPQPVLAQLVGAALLFALGVPLCAAGARHYRSDDPGRVVFDELAAMPLVFLWTPLTWWTAACGFALFRLFDIWKPWPIPLLERRPGGWGIMLDDTAAGLVAGVVLAILTQVW